MGIMYIICVLLCVHAANMILLMVLLPPSLLKRR
jgi:hypothetical protein